VDPRTGKRAIDNFESFMKFLAPLPRGVDHRRGPDRRAGLHDYRLRVVSRPVLTTGANASAALHRKSLALFSDPVARRRHRRWHRAGGGATKRDPDAGAVGLRLRRPLLHDGSAATVSDALNRHGGEAAGVMESYRRATDEDAPRLLSRSSIPSDHGPTRHGGTEHSSKCDPALKWRAFRKFRGSVSPW
jgi:hypothetical protein